MKKGFDNDKYIALQTKSIMERIELFSGKLYLEFGGKLFDDYHAARVLPGFHLNSKIMLLTQLKEMAEVVFCISAEDIESNKLRSDVNITYDIDVIRLIEQMRALGLYVGCVVITKYSGQQSAKNYRAKLENLGIRVYTHKLTTGYPSDVDTIASEDGFGKNPFIETTRPLVVMTAPGPGSGKLATCLSQLYHENKNGLSGGYAKFETFPIWNIPLKHPVNLAYEAATADLGDVNMIDPYHYDAYGLNTVNYNRDIEAFPILNSILKRILGDSPYRSPTDMGVNMAGFCISDDDAVRAAAVQEVIRRYYRAAVRSKQGHLAPQVALRNERILSELDVGTEIRPTIAAAKEKSKKYADCVAMAIELPDGSIVTGRDTTQLDAAASALLNATKKLAGIDDVIHMLSPIVLEPILKLKHEHLHSRHSLLSSEEVLIALSFSAAINPTAELAVEKLHALAGCEAHSSHMVPDNDEAIYRKLGLNLTSEPEYPLNVMVV